MGCIRIEGTLGIRVRESERGEERACNGHGRISGRKGRDVRGFSQLVKFSRCASGRVQHRASLFMASGIRVNAKVDAEEGKKPVHPYFQIFPSL